MRAIAFGAEMIRANLAGSKHETRRPVKAWDSEVAPTTPTYRVGETLRVVETYRVLPDGTVEYRADDPAPRRVIRGKGVPWLVGRYMPAVHSRMWITIRAAQAHRLHDIHPQSAINEGIQRHPSGKGWRDYSVKDWRSAEHMGPCSSYIALWESIYGLESAACNPWVWAYTYDLHLTPYWQEDT